MNREYANIWVAWIAWVSHSTKIAYYRTELMQHMDLLPALWTTEAINSSVLLAYLDPGSGSFILQLIIAGAAGILFSMRGYWSKIINRIRGRSPEDEPEKIDKDESS